jgi:hypothetical protein
MVILWQTKLGTIASGGARLSAVTGALYGKFQICGMISCYHFGRRLFLLCFLL